MEKEKVSPASEQEVPQEAAGRAEPEAMEELAGTGEDNEPEDLVLKLSKPYVFEGRTYEELDLSGLENATAGDLARAAKITSKKQRAERGDVGNDSGVRCRHGPSGDKASAGVL